MFSFIHAADIHLDSPLLGLERYEGAPVEQLRKATRRAFENLVELALAEEVLFVLVAGDLYDGDWKDYKTGLFFADQLGRLKEAGIKVYIAAGNHDAGNRMTRQLRLPENAHVFPSRKPETFFLKEHNVAIHGQSYAVQDTTENLARGYPDAAKDYFNIGVLHSCLDGREGHAPYAPCNIGELAGKGYDYWALGHVHTPEIVSQNPWIVFPGNLQGRNIRERGERGAVLVTVDDRHHAVVERRSLDVMRWQYCQINAAEVQTTDQLMGSFVEQLGKIAANAVGRLLALRVEVMGQTQLHDELLADAAHWREEFRAAALGSSDDIWLEKIKFLTEPLARSALMDGENILGAIEAEVQTAHASDEDIAELEAELKKELSGLLTRLPTEVFDDGERPDSTDGLKRLINDAASFLRQRIRMEVAGR